MILGLFTKFTPVEAQQNYVLVFSDEFNQPNGSKPDPAKWNRSKRNPSTSSRWNSNSDKVVYIKNGSLVCRAVPNKWEPTDTAKMLTGGVNTRDKFEFKYGKVEVRMKTNLRIGNFPAAWMSKTFKEKQNLYGEIDIAEVFSNQKRVHHTIHSQYTQTHRKHGLKNTFGKAIDVSKWHVYGVEWTPDYVMWTVDGETTGIFKKPTDKKLLDEGAWTFDYPFYLILNQAVGAGRPGGVAYPNTKKIYETRFDWIRVFQRK
ncbi:MAG: glycoside hydrolase family 16 protein [Bacteroidaceae bacterium]|nr:glycoside hydrolase family 16 protein [Bacteroidaceae bacterium]